MPDNTSTPAAATPAVLPLSANDIVELRKVHVRCDEKCYSRRMLVTFDAATAAQASPKAQGE